LWGHSVFQCPYCHGWEAQGRRWGYYAPDATVPPVGVFVTQLRGWSAEVTLFTNKLGDDVRAKLLAAKVRIESGAVARLVGTGGLHCGRHIARRDAPEAVAFDEAQGIDDDAASAGRALPGFGRRAIDLGENEREQAPLHGLV